MRWSAGVLTPTDAQPALVTSGASVAAQCSQLRPRQCRRALQEVLQVIQHRRKPMSRSETGASPALLLSMDDFSSFQTVGKGKDCVVYSALCQKLDGGNSSVVLKVYEKAQISTIKHRSVRREARIMRYLTEKRCVLVMTGCWWWLFERSSRGSSPLHRAHRAVRPAGWLWRRGDSSSSSINCDTCVTAYMRSSSSSSSAFILHSTVEDQGMQYPTQQQNPARSRRSSKAAAGCCPTMPDDPAAVFRLPPPASLRTLHAASRTPRPTSAPSRTASRSTS